MATFQCVVKGSPPLSVQWQNNDKWILDDPTIESTLRDNVATLTIPVCEACHSGQYTCLVNNEAGQDKCFATLMVQGLSLITLHFHSACFLG